VTELPPAAGFARGVYSSREVVQGKKFRSFPPEVPGEGRLGTKSVR
jgi:hypothetical protein